MTCQNTLHGYHKTSIALSHVCHEWRRVALNFASLWSGVYWNDSHSSLRRSSFEVLDAVLLRSRDAPIEFEVSLSEGMQVLSRFLDTILPHMWRCRALYLDGRQTHLRLFLRTISTSLTSSQMSYLIVPKMETLVITRYSGDDADLDLPDIGHLFGGEAPGLHHVSVMYLGTLNIFKQSLPSIDSLSIDRPATEISTCTSLSKLTISGHECPDTPFDLPALRDLKWLPYDQDPVNPEMLLSVNCWANLTDLTLRLRNILGILEILSRTPNLRRASLSIPDRGVLNAGPMPTTLPYLEELVVDLIRAHLYYGPPPLNFLDQLNVPKLRHLTARSSTGYVIVDPKPLWRLLERCQPPLISLTLDREFARDTTLPSTIQSLPHLRLLSLDPHGKLSEGVHDHLNRVMKEQDGQVVISSARNLAE